MYSFCLFNFTEMKCIILENNFGFMPYELLLNYLTYDNICLCVLLCLLTITIL